MWSACSVSQATVEICSVTGALFCVKCSNVKIEIPQEDLQLSLAAPGQMLEGASAR